MKDNSPTCSATPKEFKKKHLAENIHSATKLYFKDLNGSQAKELYTLFLEEVEKPFFEIVMKHVNGNITNASKILGINRITLRNRLKKYNINCRALKETK